MDTGFRTLYGPEAKSKLEIVEADLAQAEGKLSEV